MTPALSLPDHLPPEQRRAVRCSTKLHALYASNCPPLQAEVHNVSETGMLMHSRHPLAIGQRIRFRIQLADEQPNRPVDGVGQVVRLDPHQRAGIQFLEIAPVDGARIRFFVASRIFGTVAPNEI